jgi:hypothetical protein
VSVTAKKKKPARQRKPRRVVKFVVAFEPPPEATVAQMRAYVGQAVASWCGGLEYGADPMFELKQSSVRVTLFDGPREKASWEK